MHLTNRKKVWFLSPITFFTRQATYGVSEMGQVANWLMHHEQRCFLFSFFPWTASPPWRPVDHDPHHTPCLYFHIKKWSDIIYQLNQLFSLPLWCFLCCSVKHKDFCYPPESLLLSVPLSNCVSSHSVLPSACEPSSLCKQERVKPTSIMQMV